MTEATKGMVSLPARLLFADIIEPGGAAGYEPKYSVTGQIPKEGEVFAQLWAACHEVAHDTWPEAEATQNLQNCWDCITQGIGPRQSNISVQDGDLFSPEHNAGFYLVKAGRRVNQGQPPMFTQQGELVVNIADAPRPGDGVVLLINVWAMKKHERINFTLEGIRVAQRGAAVGGPNPVAIAAGLQALNATPLPTAIPGVIAPDSQPQLVAPQAAQASPGAVVGGGVAQTTPMAQAGAVAQPVQTTVAPPSNIGPSAPQPSTAPPQGPPAASMFEAEAAPAEQPGPPTMMDM